MKRPSEGAISLGLISFAPTEGSISDGAVGHQESTPMPVHVMVRAEPGVCKPPPFAQLPHDIAADPRLTPVDTRVLLALLFWARDKAAC